MEKVKILAVAPYEGMSGMLRDLAARREDILLNVFVGDLEDGVRLARQEMQKEDYDIIISRGGTAEMIGSAFPDIPLLEVSISVGDILQAIKLAENYREKFCIVGFPSITAHARLICEVLQYSLDVYTVHSVEEVLPMLETIKSREYSMVVCDMGPSITARQIGLNSILITSGTESIETVLSQAVKLFRCYSNTKKQSRMLQAALESSSISTSIYSINGALLFSTMEQVEENQPFFTFLEKSLPYFLQNDTCRIERQLEKHLVSIETKKITFEGEKGIAVYAKMSERSALLDEGCLSLRNHNDEEDDLFSNYYGTSNSVGGLRDTIEQYSKSTLPVLIYGEVGTGKDAAANYIYNNGPYQNSPLYVINFGMMTEKHWNSLIKAPSSPLNGIECTLYLKDIGHATQTQLETLSALIENTNLCKRNRVIFSVISDDTQDSPSPVRIYLMNHLHCLTLHLMPLRCRTDDIPSISTIYINQLNYQLGKQIIGFQPDALALLQSFHWQYNLDQFKRILRELAVSTSQFYITKEAVASCLKKEAPLLSSNSAFSAHIDLSQKLDDITYSIVCTVLEQENLNQKKAAERLGISRSTIWRILKSRS